MKNDNIKTLRDWLVAIVLTAGLLLAAGAVPELSIVCVLCGGIPMAVLAAKHDVKVVLAAVVVVLLAYWPFAGHIINAVTAVVLFVFPGMVAGYMFGTKQPFFSILITTCAIVAAAWILEFAVLDKFWGMSIEQLINNGVNLAAATISDVVMKMNQSGILPNDVDPEKFIPEIIVATKGVIQMYFPAFIVVLSMLMGYITVRLSGFAIRKMKAANNIEIIPFSRMSAPRSMCYVLILAYLASLFSTTGSQWWAVIANIVFVLSLILGVCGLSLVDYMFSKKIGNVVLRFLIYIGIIFTASFLLTMILDVLVLVAVFDSTRDFRKIKNAGE